MQRAEALRRIGAHRAELARLGVRSLALFGSVARDEAGPDSDVDVLVEFGKPTSFRAYAGVWSLLEDILGCKVDLVSRAGIRDFLVPYVERDAVYVEGIPSLPA